MLIYIYIYKKREREREREREDQWEVHPVIGNGHDKPSSNTGRGCFHFICLGTA